MFSSLQLIDLVGEETRRLDGFKHQVWGAAYSPDGRLVAGAGGVWEAAERLIRVWDADTGEEVAVLGPDDSLRPYDIAFLDNNTVLSLGRSGIKKWSLDSRTAELVYEGWISRFSVAGDGRSVLLSEILDPSQSGTQKSSGRRRRAVLVDLSTGLARPLDNRGDRVNSVALGLEGSVVVTGHENGVVMVGSSNGQTPHLLLGHKNTVEAVEVDPLGRWVASTGEDTTVRLWPMPDLSQPPLHTLPREELIAKLKTLTNLRIVRDPDSPTGWNLTQDPFPGWEDLPDW
jgi:WD40 repeat protein